MFWLLVTGGGISVVIAGFIYLDPSGNKKVWPILFLILGVAVILMAFTTPQAKLYYLKLGASGKAGNWLVIDNSGGETLRHWVLKGQYVSSSEQSDGWQFYDSLGNGPIYVGGDSFAMRINQPLEVFLEDYKQKYNIPEELIALK